MTARDASVLANEYRGLFRSADRAKEILAILRANGWKSLAVLLESE